MAFGMRIWGPNGQLQIDENSFTMRVVFSTLVNFTEAAKAVRSYSVPGINTGNAVAVCIPTGAYDNNALLAFQYETEVVANQVNVYNYNRGFDASTASRNSGNQRLLVIRFS
jgi:hypothetical protein